jgi:hypothetical protein
MENNVNAINNDLETRIYISNGKEFYMNDQALLDYTNIIPAILPPLYCNVYFDGRKHMTKFKTCDLSLLVSTSKLYLYSDVDTAYSFFTLVLHNHRFPGGYDPAISAKFDAKIRT